MNAKMRQIVTLSAVVHPVCACGKTWTEHVETKTACSYHPVTPIRDYGVVYERNDYKDFKGIE